MTTTTPTATNPTTDPELRALAVATDTRIAELSAEAATHRATIAKAVDTAHRLIGERPRYVSRTERAWPTTDDDAVEQLRAKVAAGDLQPWDLDSASKALAALADATAQLAATETRIVEQDEVWAANGYWSRYFLVDANNGHVHYDVSGWRCNRRMATAHSWHPSLSGLTEADAVAELGPRLCTVCFPSAPVEWTVGERRPARCAGSGKVGKAGTESRTGMRHYADCPECGVRGQLTPSYRVRAHKPAA